MRVLFVTRSLGRGGAERQLVALATGLARRGHAVAIACFYPGGAFEMEVTAAGVALLTPAKGGRWDWVGYLLRLRRAARAWAPDVIHGYTVTPNIAAWALRASGVRARLVFGLRAARLDLGMYEWLTRLSFRASIWVSRGADLIIANSEAGRRHHAQQGMPDARIIVIPNGIDTTRFAPDAAGRARVREEWGITPAQTLVGLVGRWDPVKDHAAFLHAAAAVRPLHPEARFVCVGGKRGDLASHLAPQIEATGLNGTVRLVEARDDMPAVYSALDALCLTSLSEGFPNVIGESMACGTPCLVTDVGDAARIVGETGSVVPPGDQGALDAALDRFLGSDLREAGLRARARVASEFGLDRMVERAESALLSLTGARPA